MFDTLCLSKLADYFVVAWPSFYVAWPILRQLNKKNGLAFIKAIESIVQGRMALAKDAKHDFYSIAATENINPGGDGLRRSELWAEAVFFLPAGEF